jgi:4-phytase / acid phosphatase
MATVFAVLLGALPVRAAPSELKYVVIVSRHGIRAPTWDAARLNLYSAQPWPNWGVPPGDLTSHGRVVIKLMGAYYRDWLSGEHLLSRGCRDAGRIYIWADTDERTLETGRALAESLLPGCGLAVHSRPEGEKDLLFSGEGTPNPELSLQAVRGRLGPDSQKLLSALRPSLDTLESILTGGQTAAKSLGKLPPEISASLHGKKVELNGPFHTASSLSEDLLLEYTDGMKGADLGWGRLTEQNLYSVLDLHAVESDLTHTPYLARVRGSNLLERVLQSIEQAQSGKVLSGALGRQGDRVLILSGHDRNLSNISSMLDLSWHLQGYHPDATPPGGALIFSLWREPNSGQYFVRTQFVAQTLDQMRNSIPLTMSAPPAEQDILVPGCEKTATESVGCSWQAFKTTLQHAIDPAWKRRYRNARHRNAGNLRPRRDIALVFVHLSCACRRSGPNHRGDRGPRKNALCLIAKL